MNNIKLFLKSIFYIVREILLLGLLVPFALFSRFRTKTIDVGLGPHPLINNVFHKQALEKQGYSAETFIFKPYHIINKFDIILSEKYNTTTVLGLFFAQLEYVLQPFKYKILYIYFNGGSLGNSKILWRIEPFLYKLANIKVLVMPYGADVQDMTRSKSLYFKHAMTIDYPLHKMNRQLIEQKIDLWTKHADHIMSGCEWVDYMYHWDTLMLAHFSIDTKIDKKIASKKINKSKTFKILHAPNHKAQKGTSFFINAVSELKAEGLDIELIMVEKVSNEKIINLIQEVDLVADQLVIGWYAMFSIEAMKHSKPVICYLRQDLIDLYTDAGLVEKNEIPIINANRENIKDVIKNAYDNQKNLPAIGKESREYVIKHHSIEYIGSIFSMVNKGLIGK